MADSANTARRPRMSVMAAVPAQVAPRLAGALRLAALALPGPLAGGGAAQTVETGGMRLEVGVDAQVRESALYGGTDRGVMARAGIGW